MSDTSRVKIDRLTVARSTVTFTDYGFALLIAMLVLGVEYLTLGVLGVIAVLTGIAGVVAYHLLRSPRDT